MEHMMKLRRILAATVCAGALATPSLAAAADGFSTGNVNMRAGPGTQYPVITTVYAGTPVEVIGCLSDWSWCDIAWGGARGWVSANYLQLGYEDRRVYVADYGPRIGLPVIGFSFGYWDDHYRGRPWYRDRDRWDDDRRDRRRDQRQVSREREEVQEERGEFQQERRRIRNAIERADSREERQDLREVRRDERRELRQERREFRREREEILCPGPRCPG